MSISSNKIKISVIIPVYNTEKYIEKCLKSLINQSYNEIEIICVDNGSSDNSYNILKEYEKKYKNIIAVKYEHGRQGGARNYGFKIATGKYIGYIDSDDYIDLTMYEKLINATDNGVADVVICNSVRFSGDMVGQKNAIDIRNDESEKFMNILNCPKLLRNLVVWNKIFKKEMIDNYKIEFPENVYHEDQYFAASAMMVADRIAFVPEILYYYRDERLMNSGRDRKADYNHIFIVMEKLKNFIYNVTVRKEYRIITDELSVVRYVMLANSYGVVCDKKYFNIMKEKIKNIKINQDSRLITNTEKKEYYIIRNNNYSIYVIYIILRKIYGNIINVTYKLNLKK